MEKKLITIQNRVYMLTPKEVLEALYAFIEDKENFCADITDVKFYDDKGCMVTTHIHTEENA